MANQVTSGFIPMPELPAAQLPKLRVFATNLENQPHTVSISISKRQGDQKVNIVYEELEVPGDDRVMIEVESDVIAGQDIEVVATLPRSSFVENVYAVEPSIAVITEFTGDGSTSLLQSVSAGEFVSI